MCLSNMFPGATDPDFGVFVADMCGQLRAQGHPVRETVIRTRAAGPVRTPLKYAGLTARALGSVGGADVIYAHYLFPTGAIAAAAGRTRRTPWVVTAHGRDVRHLERSRLRRASRPGIEGAAALIAVSGYLRREIERWGLSLPPVHVVNMGVDLARFAPRGRDDARRRLGIPGDGPLVLAVGGLTERKNPLGLLEAFAVLRRRHPSARLAFVGDGPLGPDLDRRASALGLAGALIRPGAVAHDRVADWMGACDVLAMVSMVEPLGQVALEALASGRPVVCTTVGGCTEIVPAEGAGRHADPGDAPAIADAVGSLLDAAPPADLCRAAAEPHSLAAQGLKVSAILTAAATR
jgi:teichuronic acid biosynthesis glycosyltransferase TuaC